MATENSEIRKQQSLYNHFIISNSGKLEAMTDMKLFPEVRIETNVEFFVFSWNENSVQMRTCLHIDPIKKLPLQIGEIQTIPNSVFIDFFRDQIIAPEINKLQWLSVYIQYGFGKLFEKSKYPLLPRPSVVFRNDQVLSNILCGFQRNILATAATDAGAKQVRFE